MLRSLAARRQGGRDAGQRKRSARRGGVANMVEQRLETPVFLSVAIMMVLRASQQFSGGAFIMSAALGPVWFPRFEVLTGIGLGLGSELLMAIAGRSWRAWKKEAHEAGMRTGMPKAQRVAAAAQAQENAHHALRFMWIGGASSIYAGVGYLFTNSGILSHGITWSVAGQAVSDIVTCAIISAVVLYLGVFRETHGQSEADDALAELDDGMNEALHAAIQRFRDGTSSERDERFIAEHLTPTRAAKFRRAVAKRNTSRMWKVAQIRTALGYGNDAGLIRALNRQVNTLAKNPESGIEKDTDGRTWLLPHWLVMEMWGEQMAAHTAMARIDPGQPVGGGRTGEGHALREISAVPTPAPDMRRTGAGVSEVASA